MKKHISCITLFIGVLLFATSVVAQKTGQARIDSLTKELKDAVADTTKAGILVELCYTYSTVNPMEGIKYGEQALAIAQKIKNKKIIGKAQFSLGINYLYVSANDKSRESLNAALKIAQETGDKFLLASVHNYMGVTHDYMSEYHEAQKDYNVALRLFIELKQRRNMAGTLTNLGISYMCLSKYDIALLYFNESNKINTVLKDTNGLAVNYINLGILYYYWSDWPKSLENYFNALKIREDQNQKIGIGIVCGNIGSVYTELKDYSKALEYHTKALKIFEEVQDKVGIAGRLNDIGEVYVRQKNYTNALDYFERALKVNEETQNLNYTSINLLNIGGLKSEQSKYAQAIDYYSRSLVISKQIGSVSNQIIAFLGIGQSYLGALSDSDPIDLKELTGGNTTLALQNAEIYADSALNASKTTGELKSMKDAYLLLSQIQEKQGDYEEALANYKNYALYNDSIFNTDNERKIAKLEAKRTEELNKKQLEIKDLQIAKARNERWYLLAGLALLAILSLVLFNRYRMKKKANVIITKEKKRSEELLLNILPSEVAEELKEKGYADAKHFDEVTVLFTDFKDFSKISERLTPAELVAEIDVCFKTFDQIMGKYGIEKIKTIGDSYMAAGGLPVPNKTNAVDVVKAALEIQQFIQEHAKQRRSESQEVFDIRVGIHTGPVVAGIVGIKKFAYDIWGDTVNIASRMESSGETGKVNISGTTYELVKDHFKCSHRGKVEAKNKGLIDMYFVEE